MGLLINQGPRTCRNQNHHQLQKSYDVLTKYRAPRASVANIAMPFLAKFGIKLGFFCLQKSFVVRFYPENKKDPLLMKFSTLRLCRNHQNLNIFHHIRHFKHRHYYGGFDKP